MGTRKIEREYHRAGVIYVCSGCETDMLDQGNGADLHLNTALTPPYCHYHFSACLLLDYNMYSTL